jgi:hypothetical protein
MGDLMKKFDRGTVQARAQEIIFSSPKTITLREGCRQALHELYGSNPEALLEAAATLAAGAMSGLRQRTYDLPEQNQLTLMPDIPGIIGITSPDGDLFVLKPEATHGQVRQWAKEGLQLHSTQRLRFRRFIKDLEITDDVPEESRWTETRAIGEERKRKVLDNK